MNGAVYLTGVPGVGKSSAVRGLQALDQVDVMVFSYSEHLATHLGRTREELRAESSAVVARTAVMAVDEQLSEFVLAHRREGLVIIDSHAVTDERFGQRVIPFAPSLLGSLALDAIICLTAPAGVIAARVAGHREARMRRSPEEIALAQELQHSVAVGYAVSTGAPLYVVDSTGARAEVDQRVAGVIERAVGG
jgi:adenylate kinase